MNELKKEILQTEEWMPNLGLMGVIESMEELQKELSNFDSISQN